MPRRRNKFSLLGALKSWQKQHAKLSIGNDIISIALSKNCNVNVSIVLTLVLQIDPVKNVKN